MPLIASPFILLQAGMDIHGELFPKTFRPLPLATTEGNWWGAAILFFSFTLIVILRVFDYRKLTLLFNGFIRASSVSVMYREEYSFTSRVSVLLIINYLLVF